MCLGGGVFFGGARHLPVTFAIGGDNGIQGQAVDGQAGNGKFAAEDQGQQFQVNSGAGKRQQRPVGAGRAQVDVAGLDGNGRPVAPTDVAIDLQRKTSFSLDGAGQLVAVEAGVVQYQQQQAKKQQREQQ